MCAVGVVTRNVTVVVPSPRRSRGMPCRGRARVTPRLRKTMWRPPSCPMSFVFVGVAIRRPRVTASRRACGTRHKRGGFTRGRHQCAWCCRSVRYEGALLCSAVAPRQQRDSTRYFTRANAVRLPFQVKSLYNHLCVNICAILLR